MELEACTHEPHYAKGKCRQCYRRDWRKTDAAQKGDRAWRLANWEDQDAKRRARYAADPTRVRRQSAAWCAANPEKVADSKRAWYLKNRDSILTGLRNAYVPGQSTDKVRRWRTDNPERNRAHAENRRARLSGGSVSADEWRAILEEFDHRCAYCSRDDVAMTMEHMVPLARGGQHAARNVVPACAPCNSSKGAKTHYQFIGPALLLGIAQG